MTNIYNAIQNLYNMDKTTWQEVLSEMYTLVNNTSLKFDIFEQKFLLHLGNEVTKEIEKMYNDGRLGDLINDVLLNDINTKVDNNYTTLDNKIDSVNSELNSQLDAIATLKPNGVDDTENIVNILNTQKRIKLLDGVFKVTNIKLTSDVELIGSNNTTIELIGKNGVPCLYGINASNIKISNINFDGKDLDLYGYGVISLFNTVNSVVEDCKFNNVFRGLHKGSVAIDLEGSSNNTIRKNKITNSGYGICVGTRNDDVSIDEQTITLIKKADNNIIENNYIHTTTMDGIFISASLNTEATSYRITDNIVRFNEVYYSDDLGIESSRNSDNCLIFGNKVVGSKGANIFVRGGDKNKVIDNECYNAKGEYNSYYSGGIAVSSDFGAISKCEIINNICENNVGEGILIGAVDENSIYIDGCKCRNNKIGIHLGINAKKIKVSNCDITNNEIGIITKAGTGNVANHYIKFNSISSNSVCGAEIRGERNRLVYNEMLYNEVSVKVGITSQDNWNSIRYNDFDYCTTAVELSSSGNGNKFMYNYGYDDIKVVVGNKNNSMINELYVDSTTNKLCWNKDGSVKSISFV